MASDAKAAPPVKAAGGSRNMLLAALVGINLLGLAGLGAYVALRPQPASAEPDHPDEQADEHPAMGPLLEFDSMVVNLADRAAGRYFKVTFQMELASPEDVEHVESRAVPVRDAVLGYLSSLSATDVHGAEQVEAIRTHLLELINQRVGGERVRQIYFTEYLVQ